jgi:hypothetical protein
MFIKSSNRLLKVVAQKFVWILHGRVNSRALDLDGSIILKYVLRK